MGEQYGPIPEITTTDHQLTPAIGGQIETTALTKETNCI